MGKVTISFTIERKTLSEFNKYAEDNCINRSALVEKWMKHFLEEKKTK